MSINNVFQPPKTKTTAESCGAIVGRMVGEVAAIFLVAWMVFAGIEHIIDDGWSFWPVVQLASALFIIAYWFRGRRV